MRTTCSSPQPVRWPFPAATASQICDLSSTSRALSPFRRSLSWMRRQRPGCEVLLLLGTSPRQVNHSGSRAPPKRNRLGGRWLLDPTWDVQCRDQSPRRFGDYSRVPCACVLLASSQRLLWLYLYFTIFKPNTAMQQSAGRIRALTGLASVYSGTAPVATSNSPLAPPSERMRMDHMITTSCLGVR